MNGIRIYIDAVRTNAKMSQREWANALGVSVETIVNWEKGKSEPRWSHLKKMSELSGIPVDYIFVPIESNNIGLDA